MHISDDILNKYIDNEISGEELNQLNGHLQSCNECLNRLKALRVVDRQLKRIDTYTLPDSFTHMMMQKITATAYHFRPQKNYFFRFVTGTFIFLIFAVLGLLVYMMPDNIFTSQGPSWYENMLDGVVNTFIHYFSYLKNRDASLIGSVLTVILLISGLFIYDSHRQLKNKI